MKINEILELIKILKDESNDKQLEINCAVNMGKHIVILQRGWVVVGDFFQSGSNCWVENGSVIRSWGTTKGLGEIALNGPTDSTKLDEIPKTSFHELTIVAKMQCNSLKW